MTVLLLENVHPVAAASLTQAGLAVRTHAGSLHEDDLIAALDGVELLGIRSNTTVSERVLQACPELQAVGAFCIGTNQIDLPAAARRGIAVFNAPFSNTRSVVELAMAEVIMLFRRATEKNSLLHRGVWDKRATGAHEVRGRTLGIVGYGNIGSQLSVLAEMLGMTVLFYDVADRLALGNARRCATLEELLEEADAVTLHVDGRQGNTQFFGAEQFARMREGALFLNLSRGIVVDDAALAEALRTGRLAGAGVDVYPVEPKAAGDAFESPLQGLPNVILTPHIGGSTEEAQESIGHFVADKLLSYHRFGSTAMSVNLPAVDLRHEPGQDRLAYIHRNVPGVLATINRQLADAGVNIEGQLLGTRGDLGYVVVDTHEPVPESVVEGLRDLDVTIRLRHIS